MSSASPQGFFRTTRLASGFHYTKSPANSRDSCRAPRAIGELNDLHFLNHIRQSCDPTAAGYFPQLGRAPPGQKKHIVQRKARPPPRQAARLPHQPTNPPAAKYHAAAKQTAQINEPEFSYKRTFLMAQAVQHGQSPSRSRSIRYAPLISINVS